MNNSSLLKMSMLLGIFSLLLVISLWGIGIAVTNPLIEFLAESLPPTNKIEAEVTAKARSYTEKEFADLIADGPIAMYRDLPTSVPDPEYAKQVNWGKGWKLRDGQWIRLGLKPDGTVIWKFATLVE